MLKFNMGCGRNKLEGFVNVDASPACEPDQVVNLEQTPWPWPDDCAQTVVFHHSLEHMGATPEVFLGVIKEIYRICAPDAEVLINVPHPRHDTFISDPTHVRVITPALMSLFDRSLNEDWAQRGCPNTPLALYTGVDIRLVTFETCLDEPHATEFREGRVSKPEIERRLKELNNVAAEYRMLLKVHKG